MICIKCGGLMIKNGKEAGTGTQKYRCKSCGYNYQSKEQPTVQDVNIIALTEDDLRKKYDYEFIIREKAESLKEGLYYHEPDFIKMCGIRSGSYRTILESQTFDRFKGKAGGRVYWGNPVSIGKMKNKGILS